MWKECLCSGSNPASAGGGSPPYSILYNAIIFHIWSTTGVIIM